MAKSISFVLVGEGSSDAALKLPLEMLCVECGAHEARGEAPDLSRLPDPPGHSIKDKLAYAIDAYEGVDIIFVHRDADRAGIDARDEEIEEAAREVDANVPYVPVIPVRALEAWLIVDEQEIRQAVGNPQGRMDLGLPSPPREVERVPDPKGTLREALVVASGKRGRQLDKVKGNFGKHRAILAARLAGDGAVSRVPSWQRLKERTRNAINGAVMWSTT